MGHQETKGLHETLSVTESMTANGAASWEVLNNLEVLRNLLYLIRVQHEQAENVKLYVTQAETHAEAVSDWFRHN